MTQEQKITAIENKIREECEWLLKDACESGLPVEECIKKYDCRYCYWGNTYYPIQLSDLLYVISNTGGRMGSITIETPDNKKYDIEEYYTDTQVQKILFMYNLSLSFKENLERSEELTDFLFNLICTK